MTKILWLDSKKITKAQCEELARLYGEVEIVNRNEKRDSECEIVAMSLFPAELMDMLVASNNDTIRANDLVKFHYEHSSGELTIRIIKD